MQLSVDVCDFSCACDCLQPTVQPEPPNSEAETGLHDAFKKIAGEDMEIDAYEFQDILNAAFLKGTRVHLVLCHLR